MRRVHGGSPALWCLVVAALLSAPLAAQTERVAEATSSTWSAPRLPWGDPDLQGVWDYRTATPLERPTRFAGREFLTEEEVAEYERLAVERPDGRPPDDTRTAPSVHAPGWLDYGKTVVGTGRTSLIVAPSTGRIPALSAEGERRAAARRARRDGRGVADSYEDRSSWERCITRGLPTGMMPAGYNNNIQILQTPDAVVVYNEMIHDARVVPLHDRPPLPDRIRQWRGSSRGRWEGDTLVIETGSFSDGVGFHGSSSALTLVERLTRIAPDTIDYAFTVEDASTWSMPWTVTFPMVRTEAPLYEYACHEGNLGLLNILTAARVDDAR